MKYSDDIPPDPADERAAAREAKRLVERMRRDPSLEPLPMFSWESVKIVFTMDGRYLLIRYDDEWNPRMGACGYAMGIVSAALSLALIYWALTL